MAEELFLVPHQTDAWAAHLIHLGIGRWEARDSGLIGLGFYRSIDAAMARLALEEPVATIVDQPSDQVLLLMAVDGCLSALREQIEVLGIAFEVIDAIIIDADEAEMDKIEAALEDFNRQHFCALGESLAAMSNDVIEGVGEQ